jgi:hypothetical protein
MSPRLPLYLPVAALVACAPRTAATRPVAMDPIACASSQAQSLGYTLNPNNGAWGKAYDDMGRAGYDMLYFSIRDSVLVVRAAGSPRPTPPSNETLLAKNQIERRCAR